MTSIDRNRLTVTSPPPTADSTPCRSEFGDTRSCSTNRQRKWRMRRRSRMVDDHVRDIGRRSFRIRAKHELREHFLERRTAHQTLERLDGVVGDDVPAM